MSKDKETETEEVYANGATPETVTHYAWRGKLYDGKTNKEITEEEAKKFLGEKL